MYCSLLALFLLWPVSCPERRNKGLEFTECLFLKSLYAFPTFFFFLIKKAPFLVVDNNTKRTLVKGGKNSKNRGIVNFQVLGLFVEGERWRWSLPGGPIFFQLKGKIFLCRDSILLNTFYNVMIIKKKIGHFKAGRRNQISFNIFSLLLLGYACYCMITLSFPLF